jgi:hypothetical protein
MNGIVSRRAGVAFGLLLTVACTTQGDVDQNMISDPSFGNIKVRGAELTGSYNPAGFSDREVRKVIATFCPGEQLVGYNEQADGNLVRYTGVCAGEGLYGSGLGSFTKSGEAVSLRATVVEGGNSMRVETTIPL